MMGAAAWLRHLLALILYATIVLVVVSALFAVVGVVLVVRALRGQSGPRS